MTALSGPASWHTAKVLSNLSQSKLDSGDYAAAERYARQALDIAKQQGGDEHPQVAAALIDLAEAQVFGGSPQSADALLRQALAIRQRKLSAAHPAVLSAQVRLRDALTLEGKAGEAEPILRQALASAHSSSFPLLTWQVAEIQHALGLCLLAQRRGPEAETLLAESRLGLKDHPRPVFRGSE